MNSKRGYGIILNEGDPLHWMLTHEQGTRLSRRDYIRRRLLLMVAKDIAGLFTPALILALFTWMRTDLRKLNDQLDAMNARFDTVLREIADLHECMAKMEGFLEGLLADRRDRDAA